MNGQGDRQRWEERLCVCASRGKAAEESCAVQPPSIWPPTRLTALSALKSLAMLCPMWQPLTGIPACRKLGHWTLSALWVFFFFHRLNPKGTTPPPPSHKAFFFQRWGKKATQYTKTIWPSLSEDKLCQAAHRPVRIHCRDTCFCLSNS